MKINIAHELLDEVIITKHQFANCIAKITWVVIDVSDIWDLLITYKVKLTDIPELKSQTMTNMQIRELKMQPVYFKDDDFLNLTNPKYDEMHRRSTIQKREKYITNYQHGKHTDETAGKSESEVADKIKSTDNIYHGMTSMIMKDWASEESKVWEANKSH